MDADGTDVLRRHTAVGISKKKNVLKMFEKSDIDIGMRKKNKFTCVHTQAYEHTKPSNTYRHAYAHAHTTDPQARAWYTLGTHTRYTLREHTHSHNAEYSRLKGQGRIKTCSVQRVE